MTALAENEPQLNAAGLDRAAECWGSQLRPIRRVQSWRPERFVPVLRRTDDLPVIVPRAAGTSVVRLGVCVQHHRHNEHEDVFVVRLLLRKHDAGPIRRTEFEDDLLVAHVAQDFR